MTSLETQRLRLRKARPGDLNGIWQNIWRDTAISRWMFWPPTDTLDAAKERLARTMAFQREHPYMYFVCLKETDEAIGFAGMRETAPGIYEEAGICVAARYQCAGLGKEILGALLDLAFGEQNADAFIAAHIEGNEKSRAVITHWGFQYTHSTEEIREWDGARFTTCFYRLARQTYRQNQHP